MFTFNSLYFVIIEIILFILAECISGVKESRIAIK